MTTRGLCFQHAIFLQHHFSKLIVDFVVAHDLLSPVSGLLVASSVS